MNNTESENIGLPICQHCLDYIKDDTEKYFCKACGMSYHINCWEKGNGCSVLSCSQRNILLNPLFQSSVPVRELLIHIEYLLNLRKYNEALNECNRILNVESNNLEAKVYYNRTVSALNIKMKIYESAEISYNRKEYKASAMFLNDYLRYCDEEEGEYINSRIKYLNELLPTLKRKKIFVNSLYILIIITIFLSAGFLAYRFIYLKEDTEYYEIENFDGVSDLKILESQVSKYERFLIKYPDGKFKEKAVEKISKISSEIADRIADEDWRTSLIYLKKLDSKEIPITFKNIYGKIIKNAEKELTILKSEAKEFNSKRKYSESKDRIERSIALVDNFSDSEFSKVKQVLYDAKNLMNKKIGLLVKSKELENEILLKTNELKNLEPEFDFENIFQIAGKVLKKSGEYIIIKSYEDKKLYAIKNASEKYEIGEEVIISGIKKGRAEITDDALNTMILPIVHDYSSINNNNNNKFQRKYDTKIAIFEIPEGKN